MRSGRCLKVLDTLRGAPQPAAGPAQAPAAPHAPVRGRCPSPKLRPAGKWLIFQLGSGDNLSSMITVFSPTWLNEARHSVLIVPSSPLEGTLMTSAELEGE